MRARQERAVAYDMALKLERAAMDIHRVDVQIWATRVIEFTKPRPWWRFW